MYPNKYFELIIFIIIIINCESAESNGFKINLSKINYPVDNRTNNSVTEASTFYTVVSSTTPLILTNTKTTLTITEVTTQRNIINTTVVPPTNNTNATDSKKDTLPPMPTLKIRTKDYYCNCDLKVSFYTIFAHVFKYSLNNFYLY